MLNWLQNLLPIGLTAEDRELKKSIRGITGLEPGNINLYRLAVRHASKAGDGPYNESNERLEYLGDAVLGTVIAEYLFRRFPKKNEGFLTEIRSRLVNGESLNQLARKVGVDRIVRYEGKRKTQHTHRSMYGDAMEALVGAVYLDKGFKKCQQFILDKLILPHFDIEHVVEAETNHKSRLIEWTQRNGASAKFEIVSEDGRSHTRVFTAQVIINGQSAASGQGHSKKKAEQVAALAVLNKIKSGKFVLPPKPVQASKKEHQEIETDLIDVDENPVSTEAVQSENTPVEDLLTVEENSEDAPAHEVGSDESHQQSLYEPGEAAAEWLSSSPEEFLQDIKDSLEAQTASEESSSHKPGGDSGNTQPEQEGNA